MVQHCVIPLLPGAPFRMPYLEGPLGVGISAPTDKPSFFHAHTPSGWFPIFRCCFSGRRFCSTSQRSPRISGLTPGPSDPYPAAIFLQTRPKSLGRLVDEPLCFLLTFDISTRAIYPDHVYGSGQDIKWNTAWYWTVAPPGIADRWLCTLRDECL